jgi:hypothetical protein
MLFKWGSNFFLAFVVVFILVFSPVITFAQQSSTNGILLEVPKVTQSGQIKDTKPNGINNWVFDDELNRDDEIRYRWNSVSLDLQYKTSPSAGGGYLKIYRNDDLKEENLLLEYGSSPLPVSKIADKLIEGKNNLLFVYIDSISGKPVDPITKVAFTFNYKNQSTLPAIKIIDPQPGAVLASGLEQIFKFELSNFRLSESNDIKPNQGKLNIYDESVSEDKLIATIKSSQEVQTNKDIIEFSTKDIDFSKISDSSEKKILFVLTDGSGVLSSYQTELMVKSNFNSSGDVGLPNVKIVEPRKDRSDLSLNGNSKILLEVQNFEVLREFQESSNENTKGYIQIFVDDSPIKILWPKSDFSLNEIGYFSKIEGIKNIRVQLVNKDFTKLIPEASDSFDIVYIPQTQQQDVDNQAENPIQSDKWRVVIIVLIIAMIVGGISILVLKG